MRRANLFLSITATILTTGLFAASGLASPGSGHDDPCKLTARAVRRAAVFEARDDYNIGFANCLNLTDPGEASECLQENIEAYFEALGEALDQYQARLDFCDLSGGGAYDPEIDPENFSHEVTNPFFPLNVGQRKVFHKETDEGLEVVDETVLEETREIDGVECTCVRVLEFFDGTLIEETLDYYAQDLEGNVWYFGEAVLNFDEETGIVDTEGQWFAGVDGAKPGIIMPADPTPGDVYRQEVLWNEAEDVASVTALDQMVCVPYGNFNGCVETLDWTPLEPDVFEAKFYAPGLGLVLELALDEDGERVELVSVE